MPLEPLGLLRVHTGRVMLPDGRTLEGHGIVPDIARPVAGGSDFIPEQPNEDRTVQAAAAYLRSLPRPSASRGG